MLVYLRDRFAQTIVKPHWDRSCHCTFYLTQSQCTDKRPTSPSAEPIISAIWQGSHWSSNSYVTGMTKPGKKIHIESRNQTQDGRSWGICLSTRPTGSATTWRNYTHEYYNDAHDNNDNDTNNDRNVQWQWMWQRYQGFLPSLHPLVLDWVFPHALSLGQRQCQFTKMILVIIMIMVKVHNNNNSIMTIKHNDCYNENAKDFLKFCITGHHWFILAAKPESGGRSEHWAILHTLPVCQRQW